MKKIIFFVALLFLTSCSFTTYEIYNHQYKEIQTNELLCDIYKNLSYFYPDTVPMTDWLYVLSSDSSSTISRRVLSIVDKRDETIFVCDFHTSDDSSYYNFRIFLKHREMNYNKFYMRTK